ncbi:YibE/F family protein [Shouchella shacheensis]|uniref:YibE/F family protein n=1 Tax=Shouchella shacheensis TaxID=1649580 RepID=UPI00073FCB08|nr:YibE/F family protein [Shouchella shacheensis]
MIHKLKGVSSKQVLFYSVLAFVFLASVLFVHHNHAFYERPIAEVVETNLEDSTEIVDMNENVDYLFTQSIIAELKNGENEGQVVYLENEYSLSGAYDQEYGVGNELFVWVDPPSEESEDLTGTVTDVKRDTQMLLVAWVFIFTLLIIGKKQGFFSIVSLVFNALLLSFALDLYVNTTVSLILLCGLSAVLFTVITLLLVNGANEKTYTAILATLTGTFSLMSIACFVMWVAPEGGLRYEEMQFLTRPHEVVFLAGVLIGSLGAVMDVAITMSASIFGIYEKNNTISAKALKDSGMEIGKDIMGTMTNILFFAYISGSIPVLILYLQNDSPLGFTFSMNLSLELARALAGGIGIVLTIPIALYISIFFVNRKRAKQ